jgi:hypothetical protein
MNRLLAVLRVAILRRVGAIRHVVVCDGNAEAVEAHSSNDGVMQVHATRQPTLEHDGLDHFLEACLSDRQRSDSKSMFYALLKNRRMLPGTVQAADDGRSGFDTDGIVTSAKARDFFAEDFVTVYDMFHELPNKVRMISTQMKPSNCLMLGSR